MASSRKPAVILLSLLALVATAAPAQAQTAPTEVTGHVTDEAGVLSSGDRQEVEEALADGRREGVDLHVLFVATAPGAVTSYAEDVARASSMGGDDALLVVAFEDRTYALWTGDGLGVDSREIEVILDRLVAPRLRAQEVPSAVAATVAGLVRADGAQGVGAPVRRGDRGIPLLPLILVVLGGLFLFSRLRSRRRRGPEVAYGEPEPQVDLGRLAGEANAALVRVDDALRDAEHEAGFAEAQFGAEEAGALRSGLEQARDELSRAFAIRQQLDDHEPEAPHEQHAMLQAIRGHADAAEKVIQERLQRLEELRGLERDPAAAVGELRTRMDGVSQSLPAAEAAAAELRTAAPAAAAAVEGNVAEAEKRLAFADERIAEAAGAPTADAARALRTAGAALAQAEQLLAAVQDLAGRVRRARDELPQELQEAELALARAEDMVQSRRHVVGREARTRLVEAQRRYERARSLAAQDPATAAIEADEAERLADEAFELAHQDSDAGGYGDGMGGGGLRGFGWGLPIPVPFPFPMGGGIGFGGSSWGGGGLGGGGFGGGLGGGSFGGGAVGGGRW